MSPPIESLIRILVDYFIPVEKNKQTNKEPTINNNGNK